MKIYNLDGVELLDVPGDTLIGANLEGADLREANLIGADLRNAHLQGANLEGSDLEGADLTGANLQGANLYQVVGFDISNNERTEFEHVYGNYLPHSSFERDSLNKDDYLNGLVYSAWNVWKLARGVE